jgi:diguanylate cyclase (GGDEF)-like protein
LRELLTHIVTEIDGSQLKADTVMKNWKDSYRFDIENPVSKRLKYVLNKRLPVSYTNREIPKRSNASFVLYTLSVVSVLDSLISDPESIYYSDEEAPLYRSESGGGDVPLYSFPLLDTYTLLRESERDQLGLDKEEAQSTDRDTVTGLRSYSLFATGVKEYIEEYHSTKKTFAFIGVDILGFTEYNLENGKEAGNDLLKSVGSVLVRASAPFSGTAFRGENDEFYVLLPQTEMKNALSYAITVAGELAHSVSLAVSIGVLEFHKTWGPEKAEKTIKKTMKKAKEFDETTIAVYEIYQGDTICIDPFTKKKRIKEDIG